MNSVTTEKKLETKSIKVAVLPGDGIGPEVMVQAIDVLNAACQGIDLQFAECLVGGAAIDATGKALPDETLEACSGSDAILFGSVGGPKWESLPPNEQPERAALLPLRKHFSLFANLRPAICFPELTAASPLRPDIVAGGFDILCIRELTGGLYFGKPKETREENGEKVAIDTMVYRASEIERIARLAFEVAGTRKRQLTSVDKMNVLENGLLWRSVVKQMAGSYPSIELSHLFVDNAAMQFIRNPRGFDVVVTENTFGDILSDELAMLTGSIGMLPSASLGTGRRGPYRFGLYEPSGGSAPDIAGKGIANPIAQILSAAMMLQYSFGLDAIAKKIDHAVRTTIAAGYRTRDIASPDCKLVGTAEMGAAIRENLT
ncbi:MAG: 3-isopropylmalate dehydrogenase [Verrucomicrobia bacterium]|nr:3-isopropylmalate dehydrogenase [Verrucomicrobiota bacterium]